MHLGKGDTTLLYKISQRVVYYEHQNSENKSRESMQKQAST